MKAYSCCDCFDYSLSNTCLEHICSGSEEARSAFILPHFHNSNKHQKNEFPPRSTNWYHRTRAFSNNRRTLSLTPRGRCIRNCFTSTFILPYQEDCGPPGKQIRLYMEQFFLELTNKATIKFRCGTSSRNAITHRRTMCHLVNTIKPSRAIHLNKGVFRHEEIYIIR